MNNKIITDPQKEMSDMIDLFLESTTHTVTEEELNEKIEKTYYTVLPDGKTTICSLILKNGYTVVGISSCVDPKNYNEEIGRKYAHEDAINKLWPLEGYLLAQQTYERKPKSPNPFIHTK